MPYNVITITIMYVCICINLLILSVCNVTISAEDVKSRSGKYYGEIKSDGGMKGPTFCWYR